MIVIWVAYRGAGGLLTALNIVYDVEETRGLLRRAVLSLAISGGGIALMFVALATLALTLLGGGAGPDISWLRWPGMFVLLAAGLWLLFRYAPNRDRAHGRPLAWGTVTASALCMAASAGVSLYRGKPRQFGRLYGPFGRHRDAAALALRRVARDAHRGGGRRDPHRPDRAGTPSRHHPAEAGRLNGAPGTGQAASANRPFITRPSRSALTRTAAPSWIVPSSNCPASGFCRLRWMTRFSGRAP